MNAPGAALRRTTQTVNHLRGPNHHHHHHQHYSMGSPVVPADPPWRATFLSHVQRMASPTFVLGTLHQPGDPAAATPRVRTVVFRGMWAALDVNPKNPAARNPDTFTSHLPTFTTDARMDKVPELQEGAAAAAKAGGSVSGAAVEGVFWVEETRTQWRVRGRAYVLGPDVDGDAAAPVRAALEPHMRRVDGGASGPWSWSREVTAHFGNLGPLMRGSFRNPPPGTPRSRAPAPDSGLGLGQRVDDVDDEVARRNFRVVVIVPDEVDRVDLSDPENGRRWNYRLEGDEEGGSGPAQWKVTELWP
ncbi:O-methyltransferase gsfC [Purpureocillium lavendulum]|uniref:O-methyltransferase gsfC n=1 Tax=Purpureocillium lavendulum TaxID=1247861 RepID=A0AB34FYA8_9HYPO|nr:O-methyltransferase gsfC [Purpureocillium lavendulum]